MIRHCFLFSCLMLHAIALHAADAPDSDAENTLAKRRADFQNQELTTAQAMMRVFNPGAPPRIIWRDVDRVRELGGEGKPKVRWFDAELKEISVPDHPGRWAAWVEDRGPEGRPVRRLMSFYARPSNFLGYLESDVHTQPLPGPIEKEVWREHQTEIDRLVARRMIYLNDSEEGAVLIAGLAEAKPQGRPPLPQETAQARNEDFLTAVRLKAQHLEGRVQKLRPPRRLEKPAPVIHTGSTAEAGMKPGAKAAIDAVLDGWGKEAGVPFVTLVARRGVIISHRAEGREKDGRCAGLDFRAGVFSITKTTTGVLFSQFMEQGLLKLDDPLSVVFPDFPKDDPHVPTFRQCFTHTSGLKGHGAWGGSKNLLLDNVLLNGLDANEPGKTYEYSGMGFDLAALAMQLVTGKGLARLYQEHLFAPLGMRHTTISDASAGAEYTAMDLAHLAQWLVNRGSYGDQQFITPETFAKLLPEDLSARYPALPKTLEGIGMHWVNNHTAATEKKGMPRLKFLGHGSFSSSILSVDLEHQIIVVQVRREKGQGYDQWLPRLLRTVADQMR